MLPLSHRALAVNTALEHENRIHSPEVAASYGYTGALVPGVNIYGMLTVPVVQHFGAAWLDRGWARLRLNKPVYEGDWVEAVAEYKDGKLHVDSSRATVEAMLHDEPPPMPLLSHPLPEQRPAPSKERIAPGANLGTIVKNVAESQSGIVAALADPLPFYTEYAHPTVLLGYANDILVQNFLLPAWIHTGSELRIYRGIRADERVEVRGRIRDAYAHKGHEFLIADVTLLGADGQPAMHVIHIAIWRIKERIVSTADV